MTRARSLSRLANTNAFTVDASQNVGIGSTIPDVRLDVNGNMNVSGTLTYEDVTNVDTAGITTTGGLVVTGLGATIGGITTFFGNLNFGGAGVGGTVTTLGHAEFAGVVTATSFSGDGSGLTGVASTDNINTSTLAQFTGGVGIADSIFHIEDSNTAIRFPAADTFTVETAGSERLRIDSAGRMGLGVTPPTGYGSGRTSLDIHSSGATVSHLALTNSSTGSNGSSNGFNIIQSALDTLLYLRESGNMSFSTAGSEALRIDSSGRLLVGSTSARANTFNASAAPQVQVEGTNANLASIGIFCSANDTDGGRLLLAHQRSGSVGGNTIVNNGDLTGSITFQGNDGNEFVESAAIKAEIDNAPAANDMPGRLTFHTTADGAASPSERVRITSTGRVGINVNNPDSYNSAGNNLVLGDTGNNSGMTIVTSTTNNGHIFFADGTSGGALNRGIIKYEHGNDAMAFNTAESERLRIGSSGQIGLGGANYGTSGQVLTSNGSGSAVTWEDASGGGGGITTQVGNASGIVTSMFLTDATDHKITATGICTITTTQAGTEGQSHTIRIVNSGSATVGFSTYFLFPSGSTPSLPTADGAVSLISFTVHDSVGAGCTQLLAGASVNFS